MALYEFKVRDDDGLWGAIRQHAESEQQARKDCEARLREDDVEPNGCLKADFTLERS